MKTLNELRGQVSAIYVTSFFHLFPAKGQRYIATLLSKLLSRNKGAIIFGYHLANTDEDGEGWIRAWPKLWGHCPSSWKAMWESVLEGEEGEFEIRARTREITRAEAPVKEDGKKVEKGQMMGWWVRRISSVPEAT